ncbi:hypothetical protein GTP58_24490 [Duganella sp. CY15W]|uniref:hypothetical protein n=1 Tax=Duganella sp. CY15W TaxID=2692172 RepID=UPI00136803BB|nr:hypothetical protein [Duganella sp. CY15W]MYM31497.1 hypothetical protein [Duganella sp. CY15W]
MTVKLLKPYGARPANAITSTLDASTEAAMIASGQATLDLTGGIKYFLSRPGLALQAKQVAVGSIALRMEEQAVLILPEGQVLKVTGDTGTVGEISRVFGSDKWAVGVGVLAPIGPFTGSHKLLITCTTGAISASVAEASVTSLQPAKNADLTPAFSSPGSKNISLGNPLGFVGADRPTLVFGRDHPIKQIVGDNSHDGTHQWFKDYGLWPYYLTVCTEVGGASTPETDSTKLSWSDVRALQADGVEITSHANRHLTNLARLCTGFGLQYTGANATATAYVTDNPRTLVLSDAAAVSFDLTNTSYDTIAKLQAAVLAVSGWRMSVADELTGAERSADLLVVAAPGKNCKAQYALFALSGGLLVRYKGTAYRTAFTRCLSGQYLQFFGDGVLVAEFDFSSGSYNTLAKLATAASALDSGDWEVNLLNNAAAQPMYCDGTESPTGVITGGNAQDCFQKFVWVAGGIPIAQVWRKVLKRARDVAKANGVNFQNFSDVGGGAYTPAMWQISEFSNLSRATNLLTTIRPAAVPAYSAATLPNFTYDTSTTTVTAAQFAAIVPALADSPGHVVCSFLHDVLKDNSSGRNFLDWQASDGPGYMMEANMLGFLQNVKAVTDTNNLNVLTQQGFFSVKGRLPKPPNFLFNPRWKNSGNAGAESLVGLVGTDSGWRVPGWRIATTNTTALAIDNDGVMTFTSIGANYLQAQVWLEPGKTYHIGMLAEAMAYTSGQGISIQLVPLAGWEYLNEIPSTQGIVFDEYAASAAGVHKYFNGVLTVPVPTRKRAYIRARSGGTFNLSANKNIRINIDNIGQTADIDCSAGAASSAAVYAYEMAAAINAAIKATAAYATHSEYHNIARAENGRLILESPYNSANTTTAARIVVSAGTTASAAPAIFGTSGGTTQPIGYFSPQGSQGLVPYNFTININLVGSARIQAPVIKEVEGGTY